MGAKGSKVAVQVPQTTERPQQTFFGMDLSGDVQVATQLSALTLLTQEASADAVSSQNDKDTKKRKKERKGTKTPDVNEWVHVGEKLRDKATAATPPTSAGGLELLPPELLCEILSFMDYRSLLVFRQTCAWGESLVHQHHSTLVFGKLVNYIFEKYSKRFADVLEKLQAINTNDNNKKKKEEEEKKQSSTGAEGETSTIEDDNTKDDHSLASGVDGDKNSPSSRANAATAARLMLTDALEERGTWLRLPEQEAFEDAFDPQTSDLRMKAFASIRSFRIPKAFYVFGTKPPPPCSDLGAAVAEGLRGAEVHLVPNEDMWTSDAWSYRELAFGPELVPVTSVEQFDQLLQGLKEVKAYSGLIPVRVPTVQEALKALARLVGSNELVLWNDPQFQGQGYGGHRVVVVGGSRAAVVQWEYYSNFCGGPYATFSCGMG